MAEVSRLLDVMTLILSWPERVRLCMIWLVLTFKLRLKVKRDIEFALRWQGPRTPQRAVISDVSELRVIREVFVSGEYELPDVAPAVILDLGSNIGISVLYFRDVYPRARLIAVEADPRTFERLRRNVGHLQDVELVHAAASNRDGMVKLYSGRESWSASVHRAVGLETEYDVPALTIESILSQVGERRADIVKMDIEGSERAILKTSPGLREADLIVFEFHHGDAGDDLWTILDGLVKFTLVRMMGDSNQHPLVTVRRRASGDGSSFEIPWPAVREA